jgi:hypothetical protein
MKTSSISRWDRCGISLRIAVFAYPAMREFLCRVGVFVGASAIEAEAKKRFCTARVAEEREERYLFIAS